MHTFEAFRLVAKNLDAFACSLFCMHMVVLSIKSDMLGYVLMNSDCKAFFPIVQLYRKSKDFAVMV